MGLHFIDLERRHRMRLGGTASIDLDDPLREEDPEAELVVRVRARAVYPNCPRSRRSRGARSMRCSGGEVRGRTATAATADVVNDSRKACP